MSYSKNKIIITGANGYVGSYCTNYFENQKIEVLKAQRQRGPKVLNFKLGDIPSKAFFENVDTLIHTAYDFSCSNWEQIEEININGSINLIKAAHDAGVEKIIFISSISAYQNCSSKYGQAKILVENFVQKLGGVSIRPGLIFGDNKYGMFGKLVKIAQLPILPILDHGNQDMYLIHISDLCTSIDETIENFATLKGKQVTIAHPAPVKFKDIIKTIGSQRGANIYFISLPSKLILILLRTVEKLGIKLKFTSDNLIGLISSNPNPYFNEDLKRLQKFKRLI